MVRTEICPVPERKPAIRGCVAAAWEACVYDRCYHETNAPIKIKKKNVMIKTSCDPAISSARTIRQRLRRTTLVSAFQYCTHMNNTIGAVKIVAHKNSGITMGKIERSSATVSGNARCASSPDLASDSSEAKHPGHTCRSPNSISQSEHKNRPHVSHGMDAAFSGW